MMMVLVVITVLSIMMMMLVAIMVIVSRKHSVSPTTLGMESVVLQEPLEAQSLNRLERCVTSLLTFQLHTDTVRRLVSAHRASY